MPRVLPSQFVAAELRPAGPLTATVNVPFVGPMAKWVVYGGAALVGLGVLFYLRSRR